MKLLEKADRTYPHEYTTVCEEWLNFSLLLKELITQRIIYLCSSVWRICDVELQFFNKGMSQTFNECEDESFCVLDWCNFCPTLLWFHTIFQVWNPKLCAVFYSSAFWLLQNILWAVDLYQLIYSEC